MAVEPGVLGMSRRALQLEDRVGQNTRTFNGHYTERGTTDGYNHLPSIDEQRRRIARDLEIARLRECIHRADHGVIQ